MRVGFRMRLQAMAAVQAKVLRLNSAAIADVTSGKVRPDLLSCHDRLGPALSGARHHAVCLVRVCPVTLALQVVNLVSNDVRRFDDAGPFWVRTLQRIRNVPWCCTVR
jgi:hypothetical protein